MILNGLLDLSLGGLIVATLLLTHVTIVAVTVFLHRHQAHRALTLHPVVSHFFRFWLWLTSGMVTREWVAVHRKHHAACETESDPHSPQVLGIRKVLWTGAEVYREAARDEAMLEQFGRGTPDDWIERNLYTRHSGLGIVLMLGLDLLLFGAAGITVWAVQMIWIPLFAAGVINGLGHWWGYRNFECPDASTNLVPWGILIGGEELHNNHHAHGGSARLSYHWWEFDIGWMYIRLFQALGLARVKSVSPQTVFRPGKMLPDVDTLGAVLSNRFQVLARYGREVALPVLREEMAQADASVRGRLRQARAALVRDDSLVSEEARRRLQAVLERSGELKVVYQFRERLQAVWNRSAASQKERLEALQEWCAQAEATGIQALQRFAARLRGYSLGSA
jgi:stearoyl-CoA desaturase (delta-9 desaturase)